MPICTYCSNSYASQGGLTKHLRICSEAQREHHRRLAAATTKAQPVAYVTNVTNVTKVTKVTNIWAPVTTINVGSVTFNNTCALPEHRELFSKYQAWMAEEIDTRMASKLAHCTNMSQLKHAIGQLSIRGEYNPDPNISNLTRFIMRTGNMDIPDTLDQRQASESLSDTCTSLDNWAVEKIGTHLPSELRAALREAYDKQDLSLYELGQATGQQDCTQLCRQAAGDGQRYTHA